MIGIYFKIKSIIIEYKFFLLFLLLGLWTFPFSTQLPTSGLDPSWVVGLNLAYANHYLFGTDVVFTYGLLGFLSTPLVLDYNIWIFSLLFSLLAHFLFIFAVYLLLNQFSARWYHFLLFIPILLFVLPITASIWSLLLSLSIFLYLILTQKNVSLTSFLGLVAIGFFLSINSLIKFDMMWNSLYLILIFFLVCYITKQDIKQGLVLSSSFVFSFFALWLILQQNIENILPYLIGGFELTNGYTEAMTNPGPIWLIFVGGISVLYVLIIGTYFFIYKKEEIEIFFILNAFILFSAFKSGFVRQGDIHILAFLGVFLLFLGILLVILINELKTTQSKKFIAFCIFLSLVIIGGLTASIYIISPWVLQANIVDQSPSNEFSFKILNNPILFDDIVTSQKEKIKKDYLLSNISQNQIDKQSIDIFPWDIALCWAYDLNWTPRPVFQSYSVYTPYLDTINSQHFIENETGPEKILYSYTSIDGRYPLFDEPKTFRTILNNYSYAGKSGIFILLNRSVNPVKNKEVDLGSLSGRMGETIKIPPYDGEIFGNITIKYSLVGNLLKIVYKPGPVYIRFHQKNGVLSPKYRLIPATVSDGVYLSQYVSDTDTLAGMFQGTLVNNIDGILIDTDRPECYVDSIQIHFTGIPYPILSSHDSLLVTPI
jgi:hypothetical protein